MQIEAFYKLSYGLYVVSANNEGKTNAYIANTVFQVTAEPPQLAISCSKDNFSERLIEESGTFAVSVLPQNASQSIISDLGYKSGKDQDKLGKFKHRIGEQTGVPIVTDDCVAWFECKVTQKLDVGSHILFIGEVLDCQIQDNKNIPMTYAYYREVKNGVAPKNAPTYIDKSKLSEPEKETPKIEVDPMKQKWECEVCGHVYDPEEGDPDSGIAPGTPFEDIPDDWYCPVCGAGKEDFSPVNE